MKALYLDWLAFKQGLAEFHLAGARIGLENTEQALKDAQALVKRRESELWAAQQAIRNARFRAMFKG